MDTAIDYYSLLGIKRRATSSEIKSAYRKLVFRYHSDRNPDDGAARQNSPRCWKLTKLCRTPPSEPFTMKPPVPSLKTSRKNKKPTIIEKKFTIRRKTDFISLRILKPRQDPNPSARDVL